jgi:hypothetical protein
MRRLKTELRMFPPLKALWLVDESGSALTFSPLKVPHGNTLGSRTNNKSFSKARVNF